MAIQLFSINGAGQGGGSSMITTANGISGTGSVASPVILGGNPLLGNTQIIGSGHEFDIITDNGIEKSEIDISANGTFLGTTEDSTGNNASVVTSFVAGVLSLTLQLLDGANLKELSIESGGGPAGISITDQIDNVGLIGASLFPVNVDPNQYTQTGNFNSGISVQSSKIRLGGQLLQSTVIDTNSHDLKLGDPLGLKPQLEINPGGNFISIVMGGSNPTGQLTVSGTDSNIIQDDGTGNNTELDLQPTIMQLMVNTHSGTAVSIVMQPTSIDIVDTANNIGLTAQGNLYPINSSTPDQYAQYGNIPSLPASQSFNGVTSSNTVTFTPVNDSTLRINAVALNHVTASGNLDITCNYTDTQNGPQSFAIQLGITPGTASHAAPSVIRARAGQPVHIVFNNLGGALYDGAGIIETLIA